MSKNWINEFSGEFVYEVEVEQLSGGGSTSAIYKDSRMAIVAANNIARDIGADKERVNVNTWIWNGTEYFYNNGFPVYGEHGNLSRSEAVALVGEDAVETVESENSSWDNLMDDGQQRWEASISLGSGEKLFAVYYQDEDFDGSQESCDMADWDVDHYEIH